MKLNQRLLQFPKSIITSENIIKPVALIPASPHSVVYASPTSPISSFAPV